jgi:DNA polymerase-3 subunit beta
MKIICQKSDLVSALARARSIGASKTPMPILSTVQLKPVGNQLQLAATDLEVGYTTSIPAKCDGEELVCIHAGDLLDRVKAMPDGEVKLDATAKAVVVTAKGSKRRFERAALSGAEFPALPSMGDGAGFDIESQALGAMLSAVHFAVEPDASRAPGNLLIRWSPGRLILAACNSHRISIEERVDPTISGSGETLVPFRAVGELRKLLDTESKVRVVATPRTTFLSFGDFEFSARRAEVTFTPYEQLKIARLPGAVRLPVAPTQQAISAVSLAAGRGDLTSNVLLQFIGSELILSTKSEDRGVAHDVVPIEWSGNTFELSINGSYLSDALTASGAESVALSIDTSNELAPLHVEPWDAQAGRKHYGVVMPARK